MSIIDQEEVIKVAHLARLAITADQVSTYTDNLSHILAMVEQMNTVDVDGVEPLANPLDSTLRLRPDIANPDIDREAFQAVAPSTEQGLYLVPQVIE
jgi:aspartyl-tRNA(Asn)/glutamyl-tRNA(Gln) amidotransferase subunit C